MKLKFTTFEEKVSQITKFFNSVYFNSN